MLKKHDPILHRKILQYLQCGDADGLNGFLGSLTVAQFRTAGYLLAQPDCLASLPTETFWKFFLVIVPTDSKAYLGTFLKAAVQKKSGGTLTLDFETLQKFAQNASVIDKHKLLTSLLPIETDPEKVELLLKTMGQSTLDANIQILTSVENVACYYALFRALKLHDATPLQLRRTCILLMRRQSPSAFRFAAILKEYFGVEDLPGTFSLKLAPWQLGRLDASYDNFRKYF